MNGSRSTSKKSKFPYEASTAEGEVIRGNRRVLLEIGRSMKGCRSVGTGWISAVRINEI